MNNLKVKNVVKNVVVNNCTYLVTYLVMPDFVIKLPTLFLSFFTYHITSCKSSSSTLDCIQWNSCDSLSFRSAVSMALCHFSVEKGRDDDDNNGGGDDDDEVVVVEEEEETCIFCTALAHSVPSLSSWQRAPALLLSLPCRIYQIVAAILPRYFIPRTFSCVFSPFLGPCRLIGFES